MTDTERMDWLARHLSKLTFKEKHLVLDWCDDKFNDFFSLVDFSVWKEGEPDFFEYQAERFRAVVTLAMEANAELQAMEDDEYTEILEEHDTARKMY